MPFDHAHMFGEVAQCHAVGVEQNGNALAAIAAQLFYLSQYGHGGKDTICGEAKRGVRL
jgi:hypothetical protein